MGWVHNREYYRIAYPTSLRPRLLVQGHTFDVLDVCERGVRFSLGEAAAPEPGFALEGTVRFRRGETVEVQGVILRVADGEVAARLDQGIPLRAIMEEQRFLLDRRRYRAGE